MITSKARNKSSMPHKWQCLQSWMRENKIPQPKKQNNSIVFNPSVKPF